MGAHTAVSAVSRQLAVTLLIAGCLLVAGCREGPSGKEADPARNLVIICIDALRADRLGSYEHARDTSPILDSLASKGALFTNAIAQAPWTVPATASLFTSLLPSEHGAEMTGAVRNFGNEQLPGDIRPDARTLAEILAEQGFRSALLSANPFLKGGFQKGFELSVASHQDATSLTDRATDWLETAAPDRFFLYIQYMDLHDPVKPPEPFASLFPGGDGPRLPHHSGWGFGRTLDRGSENFKNFRAHRMALYDGALRYLDTEIGRLFDRLQELGVYDESLIVVTSDHGEEFWEHAEIEAEMGGDPRGISGIGHGHSMFQELLHVPLILNGPGVEASRIGHPVQHLDVAPTVLALTGLEPLPTMRGRDLSGWLTGRRPAPSNEVTLIAQSPAYGVDAEAIILRGKKLISRADGLNLLFDLERDPEEAHNLAPSMPVQTERLARLLFKATEKTTPGQPSDRMELDEKTKSELRALGYLN